MGITNQQSGTNVHEVAEGIYRINTPVILGGGAGGFSFNQYLVVDVQTGAAFGQGQRGPDATGREAVVKVAPGASTGGAATLSPRLLFGSYHGYLDPSSGAAMATRDLLELLASHGWNTRVLCGPALDFERGESLAQLLSDQGIPFKERTCGAGPVPFSLFHFRQNGVPVSVFRPSGPGRKAPSSEEGATFLAMFERILEESAPDVLLTYGDPVAARLVASAL